MIDDQYHNDYESWAALPMQWSVQAGTGLQASMSLRPFKVVNDTGRAPLTLPEFDSVVLTCDEVLLDAFEGVGGLVPGNCL